MNFLQTSQKLEITTPANENQADFGRKVTKINTRSLPPEALTWYPAGGNTSQHQVPCLGDLL